VISVGILAPVAAALGALLGGVSTSEAEGSLAERGPLDVAVTARGERSPALFSGTLTELPTAHWVRHIPGPPSASAAAAENARPTFDGGAILVGSSSSAALYRLDRRDGTLLGEYPAAAPVQAAATVADDRVYFSDTGGHTWCYERSGRKVWRHDAQAPVLSSPVVRDGLVYLTTVEDLVVALDANDGTLRWRYQHKTDLLRKLELALYAAPGVVLAGDTALAGFSDGTLAAMSADDGDVRWTVRVGEGRYPDIVAEPLALGDSDGLAVVFATSYFEPLMALDVVTRRPRWVAPVGSAAPPAIAMSGTEPLLLHPGTDGQLRAFNPETGDVRWSWASGDDGALTSPVITPLGAFVGSTTGTLSLVDLASGEAVWRYAPPHLMEGIAGPPVVDGRQIVFTTHAGFLYSLLAPATPTPWRPAQWVMDRTFLAAPPRTKAGRRDASGDKDNEPTPAGAR